MPTEPATARIPDDSCLPAQLPRTDFADAYTVRVPPGTSADPNEWARRVFADPPSWIRGLLRLRDRLVSLLGLKPNDYEALTPFPVLHRTDREVILGRDDRHLDFRSSVHVAQSPTDVRITVSTVVNFHNLFGRLYFLPVRPLHARMVRTLLRHAASTG
ncbi:DUF2867 domain-containing protein [Streptomyces sp. NPDC020096]